MVYHTCTTLTQHHRNREIRGGWRSEAMLYITADLFVPAGSEVFQDYKSKVFG